MSQARSSPNERTWQAQKFGAKMALARAIVKLRCERRPYQLVMDDESVLLARTIVIATGARYNKPPVPNLDRFVDRGVHYGATHLEAQLCDGEEVIVVGGGNSAGQAAVFLSQNARKVYMLVRSADLPIQCRGISFPASLGIRRSSYFATANFLISRVRGNSKK